MKNFTQQTWFSTMWRVLKAFRIYLLLLYGAKPRTRVSNLLLFFFLSLRKVTTILRVIQTCWELASLHVHSQNHILLISIEFWFWIIHVHFTDLLLWGIRNVLLFPLHKTQKKRLSQWCQSNYINILKAVFMEINSFYYSDSKGSIDPPQKCMFMPAWLSHFSQATQYVSLRALFTISFS